jgi:hypothetical protein
MIINELHLILIKKNDREEINEIKQLKQANEKLKEKKKLERQINGKKE